MATEVKLPRLGQGMDEGKILRWLKSEGDVIESGDEIYEVETEKVNVEVEANASGTLLKIVVPEGGEAVPIGTVIAYIGESGEAVPAAGANGSAAKKAAAPSVGSKNTEATKAEDAATTGDAKSEGSNPDKTSKAAAKAAPAASAPAASGAPAPSSSTGDDRIKASPLARRIAREQGVDLGSLRGSGPEGRIVARDIEHMDASPVSVTGTPQVATGEGGERVALTSMRKTIARRLTEAWQAPAFFLTIDVDMENANELRKKLVASMAEGDVKPTVSDIITRACAVALRRHPDMNVHFAGDAIVKYSQVHIGMAVATDAGLVVPVIRDAHAKSVRELAADRGAIVAKARNNKLSPLDFEGGTFTISNLGMMGIDEFTAVLNPPMAAILAVGRTKDVVVPINRRPEIRPMMTVTLTCDHRAVDGAVGARFLQTLKSNLEDPLTMV